MLHQQESGFHHYQPYLHCGIVHLQGDFSGSAEEGGIKHALQLQDAGALNPVAYLNGLAKAVTDMGGKIYEGTRVRKPDRSELQTEAGNKARLKAVMHCQLQWLSSMTRLAQHRHKHRVLAFQKPKSCKITVRLCMLCSSADIQPMSCYIIMAHPY